MDSHEGLHLENTLTAHCRRTVRVTRRNEEEICVVLEPAGDRGRLQLCAMKSDSGWTVSDRGAVSALYGLDLDFVVAKLSGFDAAVTRRGNTLVSDVNDRSLAEAMAAFVDSVEFVPVLAGLFAVDVAA